MFNLNQGKSNNSNKSWHFLQLCTKKMRKNRCSAFRVHDHNNKIWLFCYFHFGFTVINSEISLRANVNSHIHGTYSFKSKSLKPSRLAREPFRKLRRKIYFIIECCKLNKIFERIINWLRLFVCYFISFMDVWKIILVYCCKSEWNDIKTFSGSFNCFISKMKPKTIQNKLQDYVFEGKNNKNLD